MRIYYTDGFRIPLPDGHRFPVEKYERLRRAIEPLGRRRGARFEVAPRVSAADLERVHDPSYVRRFVRGELDAPAMRKIGLPWSRGLVERTLRSCGATLAACRAALADGLSIYLGGGTHHAFEAHGSGFCVFNDVAVALRALAAQGGIERALIVDADVHQGDGTARLLAAYPALFTFSIHGANNFPLRKETSDLDVSLPDGTGDERYLDAFERGLRRAFTASRPDLVAYLAGADPYAGDRYGRLSLTPEALRRRDELAFEAIARSGAPAAMVMAGGYGRQIDETVAIQAASVELALDHGARAAVSAAPGAS